MTNLTKSQGLLVSKALTRGLKDSVIAETLGLTQESIKEFRLSLGLTRDEVTRVRYEYWKKLLNSGKTLGEVAALYGVRPNSVKWLLWQREKFSLVEAKKKSAKALSMDSLKTRASGKFDW